MSAVIIWWIRRDIRLIDNPALQFAVRLGGRVLPVFILDSQLMDRTAPDRKAFLLAGLHSLDTDLRRRGSRLWVFEGQPVEVLTRLCSESGAQCIVAEEDYSPYARRRDALVSRVLPVEWVQGASVFHPQALVKADGKPYTVFTPFSKRWKALPFPDQPLSQPPAVFLPVTVSGEIELPEVLNNSEFPAGESAAQHRLAQFVQGPIFEYETARNYFEQNGTSNLSPYLRFGMISIRAAALAAKAAMENTPDVVCRHSAEIWLNELIWREFYQSILYHFPFVLKTAFNPALRQIPWRNDAGALEAWQNGLTGVPVVDAGMRQLLQTGWMHNRARMLTASYLVKDLLINWQEGERWFMRHLLDGDPAANNGGWQWTAGVGTDAAPYFRVFNPFLQSQKFDPHGAYIRRWVPELQHVPGAFVHTPWLMPETEQKASGCWIGKDYPAPRVDHFAAKDRVQQAYLASRLKT